VFLAIFHKKAISSSCIVNKMSGRGVAKSALKFQLPGTFARVWPYLMKPTVPKAFSMAKRDGVFIFWVTDEAAANMASLASALPWCQSERGGL